MRAVAAVAALVLSACGPVEVRSAQVQVEADGSLSVQGVPATVDVVQALEVEGGEVVGAKPVITCEKCVCTADKCVCTGCTIVME